MSALSVSLTSWDAGKDTATALRAAPIAKVEVVDEAEIDKPRAAEPAVRVEKWRKMAKFGRFSREAART